MFAFRLSILICEETAVDVVVAVAVWSASRSRAADCQDDADQLIFVQPQIIDVLVSDSA